MSGAIDFLAPAKHILLVASNPSVSEQTGWPMPFSVLTQGPDTFTTDVGGNAPTCLDGAATTVLSGPYVDMADVSDLVALHHTMEHCTRCSEMIGPVVHGPPVSSRVIDELTRRSRPLSPWLSTEPSFRDFTHP